MKIKRIKGIDSGFSHSMAMKKVWKERKDGIRKNIGWRNDKKSFQLASEIADTFGFQVGIIPYLHECIYKFNKANP